MTDSRILLAGLQEYLQSLDRHLQQLRWEHLQLERDWHNFSAVAEGDYADQFRGGWQRTQARFHNYIDRTQSIKLLLQERIEDLRQFDRGEDLNIGFGSDRGGGFSSSQTFVPPVQKTKSGVSEFASNLTYNTEKLSTGSLRISVCDPVDRREIGYLIAGELEGNRIKIKDMMVAEKYRGSNNPETKGIGTMLFKILEQQSRDRAEFYFEENQAEGFWKKMKFQSRKRENGVTEYFKINSQTT